MTKAQATEMTSSTPDMKKDHDEESPLGGAMPSVEQQESICDEDENAQGVAKKRGRIIFWLYLLGLVAYSLVQILFLKNPLAIMLVGTTASVLSCVLFGCCSGVGVMGSSESASHYTACYGGTYCIIIAGVMTMYRIFDGGLLCC
jgi:hypothetical protein